MIIAARLLGEEQVKAKPVCQGAEKGLCPSDNTFSPHRIYSNSSAPRGFSKVREAGATEQELMHPCGIHDIQQFYKHLQVR